ncbi:hypothetical protein [Sedimentitalea nanhaiensis]|uniref:Uncharacterized protein n=1 Tax=Sedimentitalea nanhaiensis TaxID=999627 RepID=A0A1I7AM02_9RHOB|nr:hypothetical protein [Sedimentitalea nanhaiensis]SFT75978.1 hypothetical protein SAMN05216236_10751 [Sedimentitalea nanhaiensis]
MNMDRIIKMVTRILMRKAINKGVSAGIDAASGAGRKRQAPNGAAPEQGTDPQVQQTSGPPKLTQQQRRARRAVRQARRAARAAKG